MNRDKLLQATEIIRNKLEKNPALKDIGDTRPLPGIDWQFDVDVDDGYIWY